MLSFELSPLKVEYFSFFLYKQSEFSLFFQLKANILLKLYSNYLVPLVGQSGGGRKTVNTKN